MRIPNFSSLLYRFFSALLVTALALVALPVKPAFAASITVTTTTDEYNASPGNGLCSLREALANANNDAQTRVDCPAGTGVDIITLASGSTYTLSLVGTGTTAGDLDISDADGLTIQASGTTAAIIDANDIDRVIDVSAGNLTLDYITVTNGNATGGTTGGGISFSGTGTLTVNHSTISSNTATSTTGCGGGVYNFTAAAINITNSTIEGNQCTGVGGDGGGLWKGSGGTLDVTNSTFYNNFTDDDGGGMRITNGTATISFSTFSNNVTTNAAGNIGGAIQVSGGTVTLNNSILANSTANGTQNDCNVSGTGTMTLNNMLIESDISCGVQTFTTDPGLGAFQNNGGPTSTMAITSGSVAFDAANSCGSVTTDQRGTGRPQGAFCDLGAYEFDNTGPTVTINQGAGQADPTNASPIIFDVVFSEPVTGFTEADVTLSGTAGATTAVVSGSGTTYTVSVSGMTGDGTVVASIAAGAAQDASGNLNAASTSTDNTVTYDATAPTVTINQGAGQADPTNVSPIIFDVVFSEPVTGFTGADVTLSGTAGATTAVVSGSGTTYTVSVSGMGLPGTVIASIAAGVAQDLAGNNNAASTSTDNTVTYDATGPTVTINQGAGQVDPTNTSPIIFDVVFSEVVTGFATGDVTLSGTAGATTAVVSGSGTTYTVSVSGMTGDGTVVASIAAGVAQDLVGNNNAASTSTDNTVTYDTTAPAVTINQGAGQADPTNVSPIIFDVVFGEAVTGFATGDVTVSGTAGATTAVVSGSGTTYTVSVSGMGSPGTVIASITAGVAQDLAGNNNAASTSTDNTVTYDATGPTVTINQAAGQSDPTNASPINFTVVFSKPVTGFTTGDVTLGGTAGATTENVTEIAPMDGTTYNVAVTGMTGDGTVIASINAGVAIDATSNTNLASTSTDNIVTYNINAPDTTIDSNPPNPSSSADAPFTFSSPDADVAGFECQLDGGGFTSCSSPLTYTGLSSGSHTFEVRAIDIAGNTDPTPATFTWTIDLGYPTVTSSTPANNANVSPGPTQITVTFSEDVKNDGSAGAANNTANYLLVEDGVNSSFDTVSCVGGLVVDDTLITINSAIYANNGGSGPYVATININGGVPLPVGTYRLFICGTTSIEDLASNELNNGASDAIVNIVVITPASTPTPAPQPASSLPNTGFPMNKVTELPAQPADKAYASTDVWLEIPRLGVKMSVVGVPATKNGWDVTWLGREAGWLNGSAFPTWNGNSVLTGHVWDALNRPGPFARLKDLKYGDQVKIHAFGQVYTFEITESMVVSPRSTSTVFKHADTPVITLVTCEDYKETSQTYSYRRLVRAVLVSVTSEK